MPFGDRTGPQGMGPMTGRGLGYCSSSNQPGFTYPTSWERGLTAGINWGRPRGLLPASWAGMARPYGRFRSSYFGRGFRRWWR